MWNLNIIVKILFNNFQIIFIQYISNSLGIRDIYIIFVYCTGIGKDFTKHNLGAGDGMK